MNAFLNLMDRFEKGHLGEILETGSEQEIQDAISDMYDSNVPLRKEIIDNLDILAKYYDAFKKFGSTFVEIVTMYENNKSVFNEDKIKTPRKFKR
jgi:hypothetical protein